MIKYAPFIQNFALILFLPYKLKQITRTLVNCLHKTNNQVI